MLLNKDIFSDILVMFGRVNLYIKSKWYGHKEMSSPQSDQRLFFSLSGKYSSRTCFLQNFKILASPGSYA